MLHSRPLPGAVMVMVACRLVSGRVLHAVVAGDLQLAAALCMMPCLLGSVQLLRCPCTVVAGHTAVCTRGCAIALQPAAVAAGRTATAGGIGRIAGGSKAMRRLQPRRHHLVVPHRPPALTQTLAACTGIQQQRDCNRICGLCLSATWHKAPASCLLWPLSLNQLCCSSVGS